MSESKKPYEKPQITVIEFSAEEVLAVGCKTPTGGPNKKPGIGCRSTNCFQRGS